MQLILDRLQHLEQRVTLQQQSILLLQQDNLQLRQDNAQLRQIVDRQTDRALELLDRLKAGGYTGRTEQMYTDYRRIWS